MATPEVHPLQTLAAARARLRHWLRLDRATGASETSRGRQARLRSLGIAVLTGLLTVALLVLLGGVGVLVLVHAGLVWLVSLPVIGLKAAGVFALGFLPRFIVTPIVFLANAMGFGTTRFLVAPLFSRLAKDELLEHENRDMLHGLIKNNPGIGLMELAQHTGLGWGTVVYHTGRLQQAGLIASLKNGQNRHFFQVGHAASKSKATIALLRNHNAGRIAGVVYGSSGLTQSEIAGRLDLKPPTVTKYVKRLLAHGLIDVVTDGRSKRIAPTETLGPLLAHVEDIEVVNVHAERLIQVHQEETRVETAAARTATVVSDDAIAVA